MYNNIFSNDTIMINFYTGVNNGIFSNGNIVA